MAYNKTTWATGDTITAEKLNNNETGTKTGADFADMFFIVNFTWEDNDLTADKTFAEILTAFSAGKKILFIESETVSIAIADYNGADVIRFTGTRVGLAVSATPGYKTVQYSAISIESDGTITDLYTGQDIQD